MSSTKPLFSIIIPAHNEEKTLPSCIDAIRNQEGNLSYEIIVVNNSSTDHTENIARQLTAKVINEPRLGVGQARKTGTAQAIGQYITHIDADTKLPPDYLSKVYQKFQNDQRLVVLGGQMYYYDAPWWKNFLRPFVHWGAWFFVKIISKGKVGPMGHNMTFQKEIYDKTSGFDTALLYGEDMDICRKLSDFGKVKLDMSLKCQVSIRRFVFDKLLWVYFLNFFYMIFLSKPYKNKLDLNKDQK